MLPALYTTVITNRLAISLTTLLCLSPLIAKSEELNGQIRALQDCYKTQYIRVARDMSPELQPLEDEMIETILITDESGKEMFDLLEKAAILYAISDADGRIELNKRTDDLSNEVLSAGIKACNLLMIEN